MFSLDLHHFSCTPRALACSPNTPSHLPLHCYCRGRVRYSFPCPACDGTGLGGWAAADPASPPRPKGRARTLSSDADDDGDDSPRQASPRHASPEAAPEALVDALAGASVEEAPRRAGGIGPPQEHAIPAEPDVVVIRKQHFEEAGPLRYPASTALGASQMASLGGRSVGGGLGSAGSLDSYSDNDSDSDSTRSVERSVEAEEL